MNEGLKDVPTAEVVDRMWSNIDAGAVARRRARSRRGLVVTAGVLFGILGVTGGAYAATQQVHLLDLTKIPEAAHMTQSQGDGIARTQRLSPTFEDFQNLPGFVDGGYESLTSSTIRIVWDGPITAEAQQLVDEAAARGMKVVIHLRPAAAKNIGAAVDRMIAAFRKERIEVWGIGPDIDGTAIEVWGPIVSTSAAEQSRADALAAKTVGSIRLVYLPWTDDISNFGTY